MVYTTEFDILNAVAAAGSNTDTLKVSGTITSTPSGTQTVSGTVTANIGTTNGVALDSSLTTIDTDIKTAQPRKIQDSSGNSLTSTGGSLNTNVTNTAPVSQSGIWTIQPGNTANTTAWKVDNSAVTQPTQSVNSYSTGTFTSGSGNLDFSCLGLGNVNLQISGTWTGVISFQASLDGSLFTGFPANSVAVVTLDNQVPLSTNANGAWNFPVSGIKTLRLINSVTTGSASIALGGGAAAHVVSAILSNTYVNQAGSWGVTANAGTNLNTSALATSSNVTGLQVAQASTTSGQKGELIQGAVTTNAPSYTTAQTNPISLDTSGLLRVSLKDTPANTNKFLVTADPVTFASAQHVIVDTAPSTAVTNTGTFAVQAALNAETTKVIGTVNQGGSNWSQNVAQINGATPLMGAGNGGTGSLRVNIASDQVSIPVAATLQTGSNTIGALTANQSVNNAQVAGNTVSTGNGTVGTGVQRVAIASDNTAFSVNATPPTLTKGTQSSTGYSVQQLKDAGRTHINFYASGAASGTTGSETAITLTKSSGTASTTSGTSFTVTSGKTYRITSLTFGTRGNATGTAEITTFSLRINTGGAVTTGSTPITMQARSGAAATALAYDRIAIDLGGDGYEIVGDGTLQFGITANSVFSTNAPTWDVLITGFEY